MVAREPQRSKRLWQPSSCRQVAKTALLFSAQAASQSGNPGLVDRRLNQLQVDMDLGRHVVATKSSNDRNRQLW